MDKNSPGGIESVEAQLPECPVDLLPRLDG